MWLIEVEASIGWRNGSLRVNILALSGGNRAVQENLDLCVYFMLANMITISLGIYYLVMRWWMEGGACWDPILRGKGWACGLRRAWAPSLGKLIFQGDSTQAQERPMALPNCWVIGVCSFHVIFLIRWLIKKLQLELLFDDIVLPTVSKAIVIIFTF